MDTLVKNSVSKAQRTVLQNRNAGAVMTLVAPLPGTPKALTASEQEILKVLCDARNALNGWEIFLKVLECEVITHRKELNTLNIPVKVTETYGPVDRQNKPLPGAKNTITIDLPTDKDEIRTITDGLDRLGLDAPTYSKVVRILDDMTSLGWVQKRENNLGKAKKAYYLTSEMTEAIKLFLSA